MAVRQQNDLRLYLDVIPDPNKPDISPGSIMIFLKHFDTSRQTLYGVGKVYVPRGSKVGDLAPLINERMRWTPGTPLKLFEVCIGSGIVIESFLTEKRFVGNQTRHD